MRPINSYGRTLESGFYTEYLISKMLKQETCYVGAPDSIRDYMYVEDHVEAYLDVARTEKAVGGIYNVSPGNPITNAELAKRLSSIVGSKGSVVFGSYLPGYPQRPQGQNPAFLVLDNPRLRRGGSGRPRFTLAEGLKRPAELGGWKACSV